MASSTEETDQEDQKPTLPSAAGELIGSGQDLTTQILLHSSATTVTKSKLVSKQWFSIISSPDFIRSHTLHNPVVLSGLFIHYFARPRDLSHEYIHLNPIDLHKSSQSPSSFVNAQNSLGLNILQSCNSLLLCSASDTEYYICNPTTLHRKRIALPRGVLPGGDFGFNLAFDPNKSPHYKVVCVRRCLGQERYQLEIYSSENGLWRNCGQPFIDRDVIDFKRGVFCKGAVHWIKNTSSCLYFEIDKGNLRTTPEPPPGKVYPSHIHEHFGQCNGRLFFVVKRPLPNFSLFEMEKDYSGWFIKYVIDLEGLATQFPNMARNFHNTPRFHPHYECNVLCIAQGGSKYDDYDDGLDIVISMPGNIVAVDPHTNASKKIIDLVVLPHDISVWYKDFSVHEYFETLCLV